MSLNGRKIPSRFENPIDDVLIHGATFVNRAVLAPLRVHPNAVTISSIATGVAASYFLYRSWFLLAGIAHAFAYYLDCVDGNLARMTGTETRFGDALDHVGDAVKLGAVCAAYIGNGEISWVLRIIFGVGTVALLALAMVHFACQERVAKGVAIPSPFLTIGGECSIGDIRVTRWFGSGTLILFQTIMILICSNGRFRTKQTCSVGR